MVINMISQLQESFTLRRAAGSFEISFTKWLRGAKTVQLPVTFSMSCQIFTSILFPSMKNIQKDLPKSRKWCWKIQWKIKKNCLLCRNFVSSCKINRTLYGRLGDTNFIFKQFGLLCLVQRHGLMPIIIRGAYLHLVPQGRGLIRNGRLAWRQGAYFFLRDGKMREKLWCLFH